MRLSVCLLQQHIGRMTNRHWWVKGNRVIRNDNSDNVLSALGISVLNAEEEIFGEKNKPKIRCEIPEIRPWVTAKNADHPDYQETPCFIHRDENLLVEGLDQAKLLTKTVEVNQDLPDNILNTEKELQLSDNHQRLIKNLILQSCLLEATQERLPRRKDPERPAWIFRRDYGVTDKKVNYFLGKNLVSLCEALKPTSKKSFVSDGFVSFPLSAFGKQLQYELTCDLMVTSQAPLKPQSKVNVESITLPNIEPLHCTISIEPHHFYDIKNVFPVSGTSKWPFSHTAIIHFNKSQVVNIFEKEVFETQIIGRSLIKAFTLTAAEARIRFGNDVKDLPTPISIQLVQTDGRLFHFSYFQLNTLNVDKEDEVRNYFWNPPRVALYDSCEYKLGKPTLDSYNPDVFRRLLAMYVQE